ncbi:MAG: NUDIX domain-containing protein [Candidatus Paceibacterota bacterium]|jgi:8-oxo-dGTP pyrophosphatase MutT (NUDIX family)
MENKIDKLGWIYIENKKLLAVRSYGKEAFYVPGGKRETGETDEESLIREAREELCIDIIPGSLNLVGKFEALAHGKINTVVQITAYTADFDGEIRPNAEIEEISWLAYKDIEKATPVMKLILQYLKDNFLID